MSMKYKILLLVLLYFSIIGNLTSQKAFKIPLKTKKILFLGNSITYSGKYVAYFEAYLRTKYPQKRYEIINVGLPSETVSGLSEDNHADGRFPRPALQERLKRVLQETKPDLVFACYGMNDGIYLPLDNARFQKFKDGINWLHKEIDKLKVPIVHLTPPIFDERKGKEYAHVLDIYSDWLISQHKENNWKVADLHYPMKNFQKSKRAADSTFALANDGVHPGELGHWIMARALLVYIGATELAKTNEPKTAFNKYKNGWEIFSLVEEQQNIMKDAWLTKTGHKRPEMPAGLAMEKAKILANEIEKRILILLK